MAGIDAILSVSSPPSLGRVPPTPSGPSGGAPVVGTDSGRAASDAVVYDAGQGWKNQTRAVPAGAEGPWPGTAAVRAYGEQHGPDAVGSDSEVGVRSADGSEPNSTDADKAQEGAEEQDGAGPVEERKPNGEPLSRVEELELDELQRTDDEVRTHEQAHLTTAGRYARGGATFEYEEGPDGKRYAVAGEVSIDTSREADPAKTISKMEVVRSAALAPANPSPQDRRVAAKATSLVTDARSELRMERVVEAEAARKGTMGTAAANGAGEDGSETVDRTESAVPPTVLSGRAAEEEPAPRRAYPLSPSADLDALKVSGRRPDGIDLVV